MRLYVYSQYLAADSTLKLASPPLSSPAVLWKSLLTAIRHYGSQEHWQYGGGESYKYKEKGQRFAEQVSGSMSALGDLLVHVSHCLEL